MKAEADLPTRKGLRACSDIGTFIVGGETMYRRTDLQKTFFDAAGLMSEEKRKACEKSWAGPFKEKALPILLKREDDFAELFDLENGRPNRSVALVVGILLLKEMNDLTDEEVLGALDFDARYWYAFDLEAAESHLCQKTLHNFREGLISHNKSQIVFNGITSELLKALGIETWKQRLDSTHIFSNFEVLTRLGLFCETLRIFVAELKKKNKKQYEKLSAGVLVRYGEESRYKDARRSEGPRRLKVVARDLYRLVEQFRGDSKIEAMEEYKLMKRVLSEQCVILSAPETCEPDDDDSQEKRVPVKLKDSKEIKSDSLQTPHDEGVTYSGHKGQGYEVQIAETCEEENPVNLITYAKVTDSCESDHSSTVPVIEALEETQTKLKELVVDTSYSGAENAAKAAEHGVNLLAPCPGKGKPDKNQGYPVPANQCPTTKREAGVWLKQQQAQTDFKRRYAIRAGIEGTNSELKRKSGLGHLRVRGKERVRLAVHLKTAGCNLKRALRFWLDLSLSPPLTSLPFDALGIA
jgi:hypothetical protein